MSLSDVSRTTMLNPQARLVLKHARGALYTITRSQHFRVLCHADVKTLYT